jgi:hypothetical protein
LSAEQRGNLSALDFAGVGVGIMLSAAVVSALRAVAGCAARHSALLRKENAFEQAYCDSIRTPRSNHSNNKSE